MTTKRTFIQLAAGAAAAPAVLGAARPEKLKIAQIGVAHPHASGKMRVYRESADWEVVGIHEPDDQLWARASQSSTYEGLERLTFEEMLETPDLNAVAVETDIPDLLPMAEKCIAAGKHIHLDKPPGSSLERFRKLLENADAHGLTVQLGYMYRYNPAVQMLQDFLERGWLGEVFEVHAVMSKVLGASSREQLARFEGGMMFELGCHIVDLVVGVLGQPDKVTPYIRHTGDDGLADNMLAVFEYPEALATVKSTALEVEGFSRRHLTVCGTKGTFHIQPLDRPSVRLSLSQDRGEFKKGVQVIPFEPPYQRYVGDAAYLAKIVRGEKSSDFPSSHDLAVQETVLRACGVL